MKLILSLLLIPILLFTSCRENDEKGKSLTPEEQAEYLEKGNEIAKTSFMALSGELKAAMQKGGVEEAIPYCHLQASPLTDSLSRIHQASIRRTALRIRNQENAPLPYEEAMLKEYQARHQGGEKLKPQLEVGEEGEVRYYAPIMLKPQCLACHGTVNEGMTPEAAALIAERYPQDNATGFEPGDLRGMWSITFESQEPKSLKTN